MLSFRCCTVNTQLSPLFQKLLEKVAAVGPKESSMSFNLVRKIFCDNLEILFHLNSFRTYDHDQVGDPKKNSLDVGQPGADRRSRRMLSCRWKSNCLIVEMINANTFFEMINVNTFCVLGRAVGNKYALGEGVKTQKFQFTVNHYKEIY